MNCKPIVNMHNVQSGFHYEGLLVIGVTGGMASGKSFVMSVLQQTLNCTWVDADQICREILKNGEIGWKKIQQEFGPRFFSKNNDLDRKKLRQELFIDDGLRSRLNKILHPLVEVEISFQLAHYAKTNGGIVLVEVPLLFEAGWGACFDKVIVVIAANEQRLQRLVLRDNVTMEEAEHALASQWPQEDKVKLADFVVDNSGDKQVTQKKLHHLATELLVEYEKKKT